MSARWEHFFHVADVGVRGIGSTPEQAFEQAAMGLMAVIVDPAIVAGHETVEFDCEAPDIELLLVEWLNAIVFAIATRHMLFRSFEVASIEKDRLRGIAIGEPVDVGGHAPAVEVKGATYTELKVFLNTEGDWVAQCVVDV